MAKTLGGFEVVRFIARGGMGAVYLGVHPDGHSAAVKVLKAEEVGSGEAFLHEVRAAASLNHQSIVAVYDYGEVTDTESRASDGEFQAGDLWFAMEHATLGSLEDLEVDSWGVLRRILTEVLDALAHAHARGLVHRDLKPGNVLVTDRNGSLRLLLADFGIAHLVDPEAMVVERTEEIEHPNAGTPLYMAPEQIRARWRDLGPWTDLYALGCMAWEFATGAPLFNFDNVIEVAMGHLMTEPGEFVTKFPVPPGFERWLRSLLQKSRHARPPRAADAAWGLVKLKQAAGVREDGLSDAAIRAALSPSTDDLLPTLGTCLMLPTARLPSIELRSLNAADDTGPQSFVADSRPPYPRDWRPLAAGRDRPRAGLGLFGLREIPMVGREQVRDLLWRKLHELDECGRNTTVVLSAGEGDGKTTVLRWFGVRAHELGVASALRVNHAERAGPASGLAAMAARRLGCAGLDASNTYERVSALLDGRVPPETHARDAAVLTQIVADPGEGRDGAQTVRFGSPSERYAAMEHFLSLQARLRPVILLIDDAHWGADAIGFADYLAESRAPVPVLTIVAVEPDLLQKSPLARRRLQSLLAREGVGELHMGPMPREEQRQLVDELIVLESTLQKTVLDAAHGDTNYLTCLLRDWVGRDVLRSSAEGHRLVQGADSELPRDVVQAWDARIDRLAAHFAIPDRARECLEVAAALGTEVDRTEWRGACSVGAFLPNLLRMLVDEGIARETPQGFAFAHSATLEALRRRSVAFGRWRRIHEQCAQTIKRGDPNGASASERRGMHFIAAGDVDSAAAELERAITHRLGTSSYEEAEQLATRYLELVPDPRVESALIVRAQCATALRYQGDAEASERQARHLLEISEQVGSIRGRAEGLRVLAGLEHAAGDANAGIRLYDEALAGFESIGHQAGVSKCAHGRGWLRMRVERFSDAAADFEYGAAAAAGVDEPLDVAWSRQGLAEATLLMGDKAASRRAAVAALEQFRANGSRSGEGMALTSLANVSREAGDIDGARVLYRNAIDLLGSFRSQLISFPQLNLAVLEISSGAEKPALQAVDTVINSAAPLPFRVVAAIGAAGLVGRESDSAFDDALERLAALVAHPDRARHELALTVFELVAPRLSHPKALRLKAIIRDIL